MDGLAPRVNIVEVSPRDGFQSAAEFIPTAQKIAIIDSLVHAGVGKIQHTSFVSPKHIPQMKDAAEVTRAALERHPQTSFFRERRKFCVKVNSVHQVLLRKIALPSTKTPSPIRHFSLVNTDS